MKNYALLLVLSTALVYACNRTIKEITTPEAKITKEVKVKTVKPINEKSTYEDFDGFYKKFHADYNFQVKRIKFPLQGFAIDTAEQTHVWTKKNWTMHKNTAQTMDTSVFKIETKKAKNEYYEKVFIEGGGFSSERVFQRINGRWYLVKFIDEDL